MSQQAIAITSLDLSQATIPPVVSILGHSYQVDLGPSVLPRYHTVRKDKSCACELGKHCPAVSAVADYLRAGGERAPDPTDYSFRAPDACPVCGGPTQSDPALNSRRHGRGWRCLGDVSHYWQLRAEALIAAQHEAYRASDDYPGLPGVTRMTPEQRIAFLEAHRLDYPASA
jgi:hypothetical protein